MNLTVTVTVASQDQSISKTVSAELPPARAAVPTEGKDKSYLEIMIGTLLRAIANDRDE